MHQGIQVSERGDLHRWVHIRDPVFLKHVGQGLYFGVVRIAMLPLGSDVSADLVVARNMGGCQNHGLLLGPLNTRCRIILTSQKGTIILTSTHLYLYLYPL